MGKPEYEEIPAEERLKNHPRVLKILIRKAEILLRSELAQDNDLNEETLAHLRQDLKNCETEEQIRKIMKSKYNVELTEQDVKEAYEKAEIEHDPSLLDSKEFTEGFLFIIRTYILAEKFKKDYSKYEAEEDKKFAILMTKGKGSILKKSGKYPEIESLDTRLRDIKDLAVMLQIAEEELGSPIKNNSPF